MVCGEVKEEQMFKIKAAVALFLTFVVAFLVTTAITDIIARSSGFYAEGQAASDSWRENG